MGIYMNKDKELMLEELRGKKNDKDKLKDKLFNSL